MKILLLLSLFASYGCGDTSEIMDGAQDLGDAVTPIDDVQGQTPDVVSSDTTRIPPIAVGVSPYDLSTNTRSEPLQVLVGQSGPTPSEAVLDNVLSRIRLRVVVSGAIVAAELRKEPPSEDDILGRTRIISIAPFEPLGAEWHEVGIDFGAFEELEIDGARVRPSLMLNRDGSLLTSRFHPDSSPVLQSIEVCFDPEHEGEAAVVIDFSELIDFIPKPSTIASPPVTVSLGSGSCTMWHNVDENAVDTTAKTFQYVCRDVVASETLEVVFHRQLLSESGRALVEYSSNLPPTTLLYQLSESFGVSECRYLRLP